MRRQEVLLSGELESILRVIFLLKGVEVFEELLAEEQMRYIHYSKLPYTSR